MSGRRRQGGREVVSVFFTHVNTGAEEKGRRGTGLELIEKGSDTKEGQTREEEE